MWTRVILLYTWKLYHKGREEREKGRKREGCSEGTSESEWLSKSHYGPAHSSLVASAASGCGVGWGWGTDLPWQLESGPVLASAKQVAFLLGLSLPTTKYFSFQSHECCGSAFCSRRGCVGKPVQHGPWVFPPCSPHTYPKFTFSDIPKERVNPDCLSNILWCYFAPPHSACYDELEPWKLWAEINLH